jgi:uncharacterized protein (DUF924 family)
VNATADREQVLGFWFAPERRKQWFEVSPDFDEEVRHVLGPPHEQAAAGRLEGWRDNPDGCLALCILLDQAPRNIFRGTPRAYATDPQARAVARHAVERGFDLALADKDRRMFLYLPLEHSEELADQELCVALCRERIDDPEYLRYAERHREIVQRFGRFPHRNAILGRESTPEEEAFLKEPLSSF